jgi:hypothetical protein
MGGRHPRGRHQAELKDLLQSLPRSDSREDIFPPWGLSESGASLNVALNDRVEFREKALQFNNHRFDLRRIGLRSRGDQLFLGNQTPQLSLLPPKGIMILIVVSAMLILDFRR